MKRGYAQIKIISFKFNNLCHSVTKTKELFQNSQFHKKCQCYFQPLRFRLLSATDVRGHEQSSVTSLYFISRNETDPIGEMLEEWQL